MSGHLLWALLWASTAMAAPIGNDQLLGGHRVRGVFISPDGRYLAMLTSERGDTAIEIQDRVQGTPPRTVYRADSQRQFSPGWCRWANETRLLCGVHSVLTLRGHPLPLTRLIGVDANGSNLRQLTGLSQRVRAQSQDDVIDWTPADRDGVLIGLDDDADGYPSVFRLDVYTGALRLHTSQHPPIRVFATDSQGQVRLGWGSENTTVSFFGRLADSQDWKLLDRATAYSTSDVFKPIAAIAGTNFAYAQRDQDGFNALWKIDLAGHDEPLLIYRHPGSDLGDALFSPQGALMGVRYQEARPGTWYSDARLSQLMAAVNARRPEHVNRIVDMSDDASLVVVVSESDLQPPQFWLCQLRDDRLSMELLGAVQPAMDLASLTPMQPVNYPARDGITIRGYLTLPKTGGKPPLIVMPHGGPYSRDNWGYDSLAQFLASRGYAVLQMNFRGSTGQGTEWFKAGFQDWGGRPYEDVIDGARWAIHSEQVDPQRVCIVGASYGGYLSLLAATRDPQLFRCAVSIAGVSDLPELQNQRSRLLNRAIANLGMGSDHARLVSASPLHNAAASAIPLLMIHGEQDYTVEVKQTRLMAAALKRANKPFKAVYIAGADHQFREDASLRRMLDELDSFLSQQLSSPPTVHFDQRK